MYLNIQIKFLVPYLLRSVLIKCLSLFYYVIACIKDLLSLFLSLYLSCRLHRCLLKLSRIFLPACLNTFLFFYFKCHYFYDLAHFLEFQCQKPFRKILNNMVIAPIALYYYYYYFIYLYIFFFLIGAFA